MHHVFFGTYIYFLWAVDMRNKKKKKEEDGESGLFWKLFLKNT